MSVQSMGTRLRARLVVLVAACAGLPGSPVEAGSPTKPAVAIDLAAAERGRVALTLQGFLKPEWSEGTYENAARLWDQPAPDSAKIRPLTRPRFAIVTASTRPLFLTMGCRWAFVGASPRAA